MKKDNKQQVIDFCEKRGITQNQFYGKEKINGYLDLCSLTSIPDGFNPTVGGSLYLNSLTSIPDGFNPTVRGSLYLSSLTSIPDGFNPTVGGYLDLRSESKYIGSEIGNLFWTKGNGDTYALFDNMFCQIVSQKTKDEYTIYETRKIGAKESVWVVSNGKINAHSDKGIKEAFEELKFKIASEKLKKEPISLDTVMTVDRYRIVTGACEYGCRQFMDKHGIKYEVVNDKAVVKQKITAKQLLEILEKDNAYGLNSFKKLITQ